MDLPPITLSKIVKIILLCLVVGFIMTVLGIGPDSLWNWGIKVAENAFDLMRALFTNGFEYILVGAAVVIPIYLIIYLSRVMRRKP
ncbi:MAG: DUF6460 domain-containing protein [Sphingomonadales bacterium]